MIKSEDEKSLMIIKSTNSFPVISLFVRRNNIYTSFALDMNVTGLFFSLPIYCQSCPEFIEK